VTAGEMLIERGRKEERAKSEATLREVLEQMLSTRFGALPEPAAARIRGAKAVQLKRWLHRVLTAATLADVLDAT
jgi:hypothetical protein